MKSMYLYCRERSQSGNRIQKSCTIERRDGKRIVSSDNLKYEIPELERFPSDDDAEAFLIATIMDAMAEGRSLHIEGTVTKILLSNLTEYVYAWHCWKPDMYSRIELNADNIDNNIIRQNNKKNGVVAAFSGGVDSTFTVWRHTKHLAGYRTQNIKLCMFAHGLDIFKETEFQRAFERAEKTLATISIPLYPIHTNFRSVIRTNWTDVHGTAIVSCLFHFKEMCRGGLIASSWPYKLLIPYGSNPITDPLLSSQSFTIQNDGSGFNRQEKILTISNWKEGAENLRICWVGDQKDRNCEKCEKCIRTKMEFQANGLKVPACFTGPANSYDVKRLFISTDNFDKFYLELLRLAQNNKIKDKWVSTLRFVIWRSRIIRLILKIKPLEKLARILYSKVLLKSDKIAKF